MRRRLRRTSTRRTTLRRRVGDAGVPAAGLIVGLHGYGSDEHQLVTLMPLDVPVVTVYPRADHAVEPGFGWWLPERTSDGLELAPVGGIETAVARVVDVVTAAQAKERVPPERTVVVGYSQGATLALSFAARHPELVGAAVAAAGLLVPGERVRYVDRPIDVLLMNGTLDPFVDIEAHTDTVDRFIRAGHTVTQRRDPVPHVIDRAQIPDVNEFVATAVRTENGGQ